MILIVDDEPGALVLLEMVLKQDKHVVVKATSGKAALMLLEQEAAPCGLVISDIRMPGMGGRELLYEMRANPRLASIPVIMCSSQADRSTVVDLIGQGIRDYIVKPISPGTVLAKVRAILAEQNRPVIEPREETIGRLQLDPLEYVPLAQTAIPPLEAVAEDLAAALRIGNARGARDAALRVIAQARPFGAGGTIEAAQRVAQAGADLDALRNAGVLITELGRLRSALVRTGLIRRDAGDSGTP